MTHSYPPGPPPVGSGAPPSRGGPRPPYSPAAVSGKEELQWVVGDIRLDSFVKKVVFSNHVLHRLYFDVIRDTQNMAYSAITLSSRKVPS